MKDNDGTRWQKALVENAPSVLAAAWTPGSGLELAELSTAARLFGSFRASELTAARSFGSRPAPDLAPPTPTVV